MLLIGAVLAVWKVAAAMISFSFLSKSLPVDKWTDVHVKLTAALEIV